MPRYKIDPRLARWATALVLVLGGATAGIVWASSGSESSAHPADNYEGNHRIVTVHTSGMSMPHGGSMPMGGAAKSKLARQVTQARSATAKYVLGLKRAKADGYQIITPMIPNMGFHYMNPAVKKFNVRKPMILVYQRNQGRWQLGALEWVFPGKPAKAPLPGAKYGSFPAACHYKDGTFIESSSQDQCAAKNPKTDAAFTFWHPPLVTLHVWAWFHNPSGIFSGMNPLVAPLNG